MGNSAGTAEFGYWDRVIIMKIYFSGALRASTQGWDTYGQLIMHLKKYGKVLTSHFHHGAFSIGKKQEMSDEEIFELYIKLLKEADFVIQEVSTPSIGVGYETAKALELGKPVFCLYRSDTEKKLSTLISGNKAITLKSYNTLEEAFREIDVFIQKNKR